MGLKGYCLQRKRIIPTHIFDHKYRNFFVFNFELLAIYDNYMIKFASAIEEYIARHVITELAIRHKVTVFDLNRDRFVLFGQGRKQWHTVLFAHPFITLLKKEHEQDEDFLNQHDISREYAYFGFYELSREDYDYWSLLDEEPPKIHPKFSLYDGRIVKAITEDKNSQTFVFSQEGIEGYSVSMLLNYLSINGLVITNFTEDHIQLIIKNNNIELTLSVN